MPLGNSRDRSETLCLKSDVNSIDKTHEANMRIGKGGRKLDARDYKTEPKGGSKVQYTAKQDSNTQQETHQMPFDWVSQSSMQVEGVNSAIWTERMLAALVNGVKGKKWP